MLPRERVYRPLPSNAPFSRLRYSGFRLLCNNMLKQDEEFPTNTYSLTISEVYNLHRWNDIFNYPNIQPTVITRLLLNPWPYRIPKALAFPTTYALLTNYLLLPPQLHLQLWQIIFCIFQPSRAEFVLFSSTWITLKKIFSCLHLIQSNHTIQKLQYSPFDFN
jgi:hypothetical protein